MGNEGSANPSALVVNLNEDVRQADASKLHVTTHPFGESGKGDATVNSLAVAAGATVVVATRTVPVNTKMRVHGIVGSGEADGRWSLVVGGVEKSHGLNSAAEPAFKDRFAPPFEAAAGVVVDLKVRNLGPRTYTFEGALHWSEESVV